MNGTNGIKWIQMGDRHLQDLVYPTPDISTAAVDISKQVLLSRHNCLFRAIWDAKQDSAGLNENVGGGCQDLAVS